MKIRNGFVSNSSSTSFIIAVSPLNTCPHCGRSDSDIITLIEGESNNNNDTDVRRYHTSEIIEELEAKIENDEFYLEKYRGRKDNEKTNYSTVGKEKRGYKESIERNKELVKEIRKADEEGKIVYQVSISYHSELNKVLKSNKNVEILDKED